MRAMLLAVRVLLVGGSAVLDPTLGETVTVWFHRATGARAYVRHPTP